MEHLTHSVPELIVLGVVILSFATFGVSLLGVSLYVELGHRRQSKAPVAQVTPARRPRALTLVDQA
jgi:hypothetical protein